jgi:murein L,D-transpeptidase YcbB/YkuD
MLLTASPFAIAMADEALSKPPTTAATSLDPPAPKSASAMPEDVAPIGALKETSPAPSSRPISKLDLSPPPGLLPDLPPELQPPSFGLQSQSRNNATPPSDPRKDATTDIDVTFASPDSALPARPDTAAQPSATPIGGSGQSALPPPADGTAAMHRTQAEVLPEAPADAAEASGANVLADEVRGALDRFVGAEPAGHPIGAGDWSAARKAIAAFYAERNYAPLWMDGDHLSVGAKSALSRLAKAGEDGLSVSGSVKPTADWSDRAPSAQAEADVEISAAIVAYAMQATGARINPRSLSKDVSAKPEVADPAFVLKSVAAAEDADAALAGFNPPQAGYRALRAALAAMRDESQTPVARFSPGPVLKLGMSDPRVPLIRARFGLSSLKVGSSSQVYDVRVASAVAAFQRVHGLPVNGALTQATANALDGANARERRELLILANMEMWRWEPRDMGETRVEVNVPDFSLKLMSGDSVIRRARVIVGKPDTPTPIFSNSIKYMLFNPVWRVPDSIIKKEMAPKYAADPDYFTRHGYKVSYVGHKLLVEQPPGEENALGRMLFLFPNEHAVYLHDTPQRALFSASYRALSHGCVRVENPSRLAEILMGGANRGWTDAKVRSLLGDKERTFSLPAPVPIHLEYFTEFVDENGALHEPEDLYGLTRKVALALVELRQD